jgi:hypothetical protein
MYAYNISISTIYYTLLVLGVAHQRNVALTSLSATILRVSRLQLPLWFPHTSRQVRETLHRACLLFRSRVRPLWLTQFTISWVSLTRSSPMTAPLQAPHPWRGAIFCAKWRYLPFLKMVMKGYVANKNNGWMVVKWRRNLDRLVLVYWTSNITSLKCHSITIGFNYVSDKFVLISSSVKCW